MSDDSVSLMEELLDLPAYKAILELVEAELTSTEELMRDAADANTALRLLRHWQTINVVYSTLATGPHALKEVFEAQRERAVLERGYPLT